MKKQHDLRFLFIIVTKHFILITMNDLTVFWADSSVIKTSVEIQQKDRRKNNLIRSTGSARSLSRLPTANFKQIYLNTTMSGTVHLWFTTVLHFSDAA